MIDSVMMLHQSSSQSQLTKPVKFSAIPVPYALHQSAELLLIFESMLRLKYRTIRRHCNHNTVYIVWICVQHLCSGETKLWPMYFWGGKYFKTSVESKPFLFLLPVPGIGRDQLIKGSALCSLGGLGSSFCRRSGRGEKRAPSAA